MGDRYMLSLRCATCKGEAREVYYAPSSGFLHFSCPCGAINRVVRDFHTEAISEDEAKADIEAAESAVEDTFAEDWSSPEDAVYDDPEE